ncbi:hypothetical protein NDN08_001846 [Rhodosorus marinus]|uniref:Uncharacterized protein n=1 Tax=Rhodosorus marinus TaxID=101924 RepID=A0AAV8US44_9RHOD|nr:hypothetical protein NDN08_001846 [Rhodosorus marinus]
MAFVSGAGGVPGGRTGVRSVCNRPSVRIACKAEGSEEVGTGPASRLAEVGEEKAGVEVATEATVEASESEAYRPCPEYIKTKKYKRAGQNLAEIGGFVGKGFE